MGVVSDLIDGVVDLSESTAEFASERLRSLTLLGGLALVLVFLLLLALVEPAIAAIVAVAFAVVYGLRDDSPL